MLRLMRDILASLPGAAGSKELHQCIQLFTATALDQVLNIILTIMMLTTLCPVFGERRRGGDGLGLELRVPPRVPPHPLNTKAAHQPGDRNDGDDLTHCKCLEKVGWCFFTISTIKTPEKEVWGNLPILSVTNSKSQKAVVPENYNDCAYNAQKEKLSKKGQSERKRTRPRKAATRRRQSVSRQFGSWPNLTSSMGGDMIWCVIIIAPPNFEIACLFVLLKNYSVSKRGGISKWRISE